MRRRPASEILELGLLLINFLMLCHVALGSRVSVDLTEQQNKVYKIKVGLHSRGTLWATGHFMGKRSIVDSLLLESPEPKRSVMQTSVDPTTNVNNLRELITKKVLKVALQDHLKDMRERNDSSDQSLLESLGLRRVDK